MTPYEIECRRDGALAEAIRCLIEHPGRYDADRWRAVAERWNALLQDAMPVFGGAS